MTIEKQPFSASEETRHADPLEALAWLKMMRERDWNEPLATLSLPKLDAIIAEIERLSASLEERTRQRDELQNEWTIHVNAAQRATDRAEAAEATLTAAQKELDDITAALESLAVDGGRQPTSWALSAAWLSRRTGVKIADMFTPFGQQNQATHLESFNINNRVWVRLTDAGRAHLRQVWPSYETSVKEHDGWSRWALWSLMESFGTAIYHGCDVPFEADIKLEAALTASPAATNDEWLKKRAAIEEESQLPAELAEGALPSDEAMIEQFCRDLNGAHDEVLRAQGVPPETFKSYDWPEWSGPANSIRWAEQRIGKPLSKSKLAAGASPAATKEAGMTCLPSATCASCGSEHIAERIEVDRWTIAYEGLPELSASLPVMRCEDCGVEWTDYRAEEIRDAIHAAVKPRWSNRPAAKEPLEAPSCEEHGTMVPDDEMGRSWHCAACHAIFAAAKEPQ